MLHKLGITWPFGFFFVPTVLKLSFHICSSLRTLLTIVHVNSKNKKDNDTKKEPQCLSYFIRMTEWKAIINNKIIQRHQEEPRCLLFPCPHVLRKNNDHGLYLFIYHWQFFFSDRFLFLSIIELFLHSGSVCFKQKMQDILKSEYIF